MNITQRQPVLIGTVSVEVSELLSKMLKQKEFHNVLNAKQHQSEAQIVAQAGLKNQLLLLLIWQVEEQILS